MAGLAFTAQAGEAGAVSRFQRVMAREPFILAEGAVIERLRRDPQVSLDPHIAHAGLIRDSYGRAALELLYRGYLDVGRVHALPMMVLTPTWRASAPRLERAGVAESDDLNEQCVRFLSDLVRACGSYGERVLIGGLMGCVGDAYRPQEALSTSEAWSLHSFQAQALARGGVDLLVAATLPAFSEAMGLAMAMAQTGLPYVLSFVLRPSGALLDSTPFHRAISAIDQAVHPSPWGYMVNCVHPTVFAQALNRTLDASPAAGERVLGLQANTSPRPPEELEGLACLESQDPGLFADAMIELLDRYNVKVLGGCCGTDDRHIQAIAQRVRKRSPNTSPSGDSLEAL